MSTANCNGWGREGILGRGWVIQGEADFVVGHGLIGKGELGYEHVVWPLASLAPDCTIRYASTGHQIWYLQCSLSAQGHGVT
eukprot:3666039-Rhodomonas_salina.1